MTYEEMAAEIEKTFGIDLEDNPENLISFFRTVLKMERRAQIENQELLEENSDLLMELNELRRAA